MSVSLFGRLSTCSKRALLKVKGRWGRPYKYKPRGTLLVRLAKETGMSIDEVYIQLMKERQALINHLNLD